jgi:uncharacterized protein YggE
MVRQLKVQGKGYIRVEPDLVTLSFNVESRAKDYEKSIQNLNLRADDLRESMIASGLDKAHLKTTAFNVQVETQYVDGQNIFAGYVAAHRMQIELPMDKLLMNQVFKHVAQSHSGAEIRLNFSVKDKDAMRKRVLAQAVKTAKENAASLAEAAGVRLGKLIQIDYGPAEAHIYDREVSVLAQSTVRMAKYEVDIEPADVSAEDNVTLTYEITD